ncbi:MAG: hypothetical protein JWM80_3849 [Cyanobacteria bacterium RYN_339]|nr:hypothetical protein [Cyanobacteria bacterium RYN_339]
MSLRTPRVLVLALASAALASGCQAAAAGYGVQLVPLAAEVPHAAPIFESQPSIARVIPADGLAHVETKVNIIDNSPTHTYGLLALPGTWTSSLVTLLSPTANGAYNAAKNSVTLGFGAYGCVAGVCTATAIFPPLRPAADYAGQVFLQNTSGTLRLAGSSSGTYTLNAGANTLTWTVNPNANEATFNVASSSNNNVVTGNSVVKGDTVVLNTGIAANQPAVSYVDVLISGVAYGSPVIPVNIARLATAASWNQFTWNTANDNLVLPSNYVAATFTGGAGTATTAGTLDFQAYDVYNQLVGKASLTLAVFGTPAVTVKVQ